jgi:two-component system sensor histidine kinase KdpD
MPDPVATPGTAGLPEESAVAAGATALALLVALAAERWLGVVDLSLPFITAVIVVASRSRLGVAVGTALLGFLAYNFFFVEPRHSLLVATPQGAATLAGLLAAALVCGRLASRLHSQVLLLHAANAQAALLQGLARRLTSAVDEDEALAAATEAMREAFDAEVLLLPVDESTGRPLQGTPQVEACRHDPALQLALAHCLERLQRAATPGDDRLGLSWQCFPVRLRDRLLALACLRFATALPRLSPTQGELLEAMLRDLGQALARARLVRQVEQVRLQGEGERLRAALLSSVSHDLRSPLSTIIGSAESLTAYRDQLSVADQVALARDIHDEGRRLDHYIQNLLDMTRVGQGALSLRREWAAMDEVCGSLLARLRRAHPQARFELDLPAPTPWLHANPSLLEQALYNALDNAARFSPPGEPILLQVRRDPPWMQVDVVDRGPGIPESERTRVFERFYTAEAGRRGSGGGTGLGLTICQGILAAHGGQVEALAGSDGRGTILRMRLPLAPAPFVPSGAES